MKVDINNGKCQVNFAIVRGIVVTRKELAMMMAAILNSKTFYLPSTEPAQTNTGQRPPHDHGQDRRRPTASIPQEEASEAKPVLKFGTRRNTRGLGRGPSSSPASAHAEACRLRRRTSLDWNTLGHTRNIFTFVVGLQTWCRGTVGSRKQVSAALFPAPVLHIWTEGHKKCLHV